MTSIPLLTFDDGPSDSTEEVLDLLDVYGLRAVFFVIGFRAERRPDLVRRAADAGHVIGNHTWDHMPLGRTLDEAVDDMDLRRRAALVRRSLSATSELLASIVGRAPTLFRAPWFDVNGRVIDIADGLGLRHLAAQIDTRDWEPGRSSGDIAAAVNSAGSGQTVVLHDGTGDDLHSQLNPPRPRTVEGLRQALPEFADRWQVDRLVTLV